MHTQGLSWALILVTRCFLVLWCAEALKEKNDSNKEAWLVRVNHLPTAERAVEEIALRCMVGSPLLPLQHCVAEMRSLRVSLSLHFSSLLWAVFSNYNSVPGNVVVDFIFSTTTTWETSPLHPRTFSPRVKTNEQRL